MSVNLKTKEANVGVVIPTYNRRERLVRAIESVLAQTVRPDEIVVVDDCSDFSVDEFLKECYGDSVRVITNATNQGPAEARNIGVRNVKTEFVAFLDSDDYWEPEKLEKQMAVFAARPEIVLVYCDQWRVRPDGTRVKSGKKLIDHEIWKHLLMGWTAPNPSSLIFKRSFYLKLGGFDSKTDTCEDHDFWMQMAYANARVAFVPERLSNFTMGTGQISLDYDTRFIGMDGFLVKWEKPIVESRGRNFYRWFRNDYRHKVAWPVFFLMIRHRELKKSASVFFRFLALNSLFYKHFLARVIYHLKRHNA